MAVQRYAFFGTLHAEEVSPVVRVVGFAERGEVGAGVPHHELDVAFVGDVDHALQHRILQQVAMRTFFEHIAWLADGDQAAGEIAFPHALVAHVRLSLPEVACAISACDGTPHGVAYAVVRVESLCAGVRLVAGVRDGEGGFEGGVQLVGQLGVELVRPCLARLRRVVQREHDAVLRAFLHLPFRVAGDAVYFAALRSFENEPRPVDGQPSVYLDAYATRALGVGLGQGEHFFAASGPPADEARAVCVRHGLAAVRRRQFHSCGTCGHGRGRRQKHCLCLYVHRHLSRHRQTCRAAPKVYQNSTLPCVCDFSILLEWTERGKM